MSDEELRGWGTPPIINARRGEISFLVVKGDFEFNVSMPIDLLEDADDCEILFDLLDNLAQTAADRGYEGFWGKMGNKEAPCSG